MRRSIRGLVCALVSVLPCLEGPAHAVGSNAMVPFGLLAAPCGPILGTRDASDVAFSPDGTSVYVVSQHGAVGHFVRTPATGAVGFRSAVVQGVGGVTQMGSPVAVDVSPDGAHVYVASTRTSGVGSTVLAFARDGGTGVLSPVQVVTEGGGVTGIRDASDVVVSPDGAHVYVAGPGFDDGLAVFARNPGTGALTFVAAHFDGVGGDDGLRKVRRLALSPDGAHLYTTADEGVGVFARNAATGDLTFVEVHRSLNVGGTELLHEVTFATPTPDGAHVLVGAQGFATLTVFARNAGTGALTFVEFHRDGVGGIDRLAFPTDAVVSPDGAQVYVSGGEFDEVHGDSAVTVFARDAGTGALTLLEVQQHGVGLVDRLYDPWRLAVSPDGTSVVAVAGEGYRVHNHLTVFDRAPATGQLTLADVQQGATFGPMALAATVDGEHLYTACRDQNAVAVLARDGGTGVLSPIEKQRGDLPAIHAMRRATDVAVTADGAHVYVLGAGDGTVAGFARDAGTGALTFVGAQAGDLGAVAGPLQFADGKIAVSPDGANVYAARRLANAPDSVAIYARTPATGALTLVQAITGGGALGALDPITDLAVASDGAQVYVAAAVTGFDGDELIYVFARDPGTGTLTFVEHEIGGGNPRALAASVVDTRLHAGDRNGLVVTFDRGPASPGLHIEDTEAGFLSVSALAVATDGAHVYAVGGGLAPALGVFRRDGSRALGFAGQEPLPTIEGTPSGWTAVASVGGRDVYVAAERDAIAAYRHATPCAPAPLAGCRSPVVPRRASVVLRDRASDKSNALKWKWVNGDATAIGDFGDPSSLTDWAVCLYDASGAPQPVAALLAPAGGTCVASACWTASSTGWRYGDRERSPDGIRRLQLRAGAAGKAKITVIAGGVALPLPIPPALPLTPPVQVQAQASNGECWQAVFSTPTVNDAEQFKAKAD